MDDFEQNLRALIAKNWPIDIVQEKFSATYDRAVDLIESQAEPYVENAWQAVFRYESRVYGPEFAVMRVTDDEDHVPPRELFKIKQEYFSQTKQHDAFENMCLENIRDRKLLALSYDGVILYYCRSGQIEKADRMLQESVGEGLRGAVGANLRFAHMLGKWDIFDELLAIYKDRHSPDDLNARRWSYIQKWVSESSSRSFPYPHHFINLDRAAGRRQALEKRYARYGDRLNFVRAVDGTQMSREEYEMWCPTGRLHVGGVANLRSQMSVWKAFLASDESHILIFEDDAWPYADLASWGDLTYVVEAENPDMVFVNDRGAGTWWDRQSSGPWSPFFASISTYTDAMRAPGLDGYLLSRRGAEILIENFETDRVVTNIDWQVVAYALTEDEMTKMPHGVQRTVIGNARRHMASTARLRAFVMNRPAVCQFAAGHATVNETNLLVQWAKNQNPKG